MLPLAMIFAAVLIAARPAPASADEGVEYFEKHVRPVLAEHCYECHSVERQRGGLRLDSLAAILEGGDSGTAMVRGEPDRSRLIEGIRYKDVNFQMPPRYRLEDEDIAALEKWVQMGAPWPDEPAPQELEEAPFEEVVEHLKQTHWSLQPVADPELPSVEREDWVQTPVDRFVLAKLEEAGLEPSLQADRRTLIRRAYFDLIGLPPTFEQVEAFVADESPDAWAKVIDELLASPHYGERWGRHWLDVARYGDTTGYIAGSAPTRYPYAYTYRDYVINAFNDDKPYDQFIVEQLAADKLGLEGEQREALAAMGLLTVGRRFQNNQHDIIDDRIDVVTRGFMGLSVSCARCHDHKYDPVPTADYYAMYGVFNSSHEPAEKPLVRDPEPTPEYQAFQDGLQEIENRMNAWREERRLEIQHQMRSRVADYLEHAARRLAGEDPSPQGERGPLIRHATNQWNHYLVHNSKDNPAWRLWHELQALEGEGFAEAAAEVLNREREKPVNAMLLEALRANPPSSMREAARTYGSVLEQVYNSWREQTQDVPTEQHPERLADDAAEAIRQVILSEHSPLTIAGQPDRWLDQAQRNRLNQFRGEMETFTANSPGAPGRAMIMVDHDQPRNPYIFRRGQAGNRGENVPRRFLQVLDHVDGGETYDDSSGRLRMAQAIASEKNPLTPRVMVNRIWHYHMGHGIVRTPSDFGTRGERPSHPQLLDHLATQFMEGGWKMKRIHRQIMLSATYQQVSYDRSVAQQQDPENRLLWKMNRQRLEFEPMRDAVLAASGKLDRTVGGRSQPIHEDSPRRAVYAYLDREDLPGLYRNFDVANPDATTATRSETTVPQQALFMMNSPFMSQQARAVAERAKREAAEDSAEQVIQAVYEVTLSRQPSEEELALGESFVSGAAVPAERPAPRWQFGYGRYDGETQQVTSFAHLPHFTGDTWQGGPEVPDPQLNWALLNAGGGHPGVDHDHAVIRRFTVPAAGTIVIDGTLKHNNENGDGVIGTIVSHRGGQLGHWRVHNGETHAHVPSVTVEAGEVIDFVVAPGETHSHDGYSWAPKVRYVTVDQADAATVDGEVFDAAANFIASSEASEHFGGQMDLWSQYAQVLMLSNEFVFID